METSGGIRASLAGRYASALFDLARDEKQIDSVSSSLKALSQALADSPEFGRLLNSPLVDRDEAQQAFAAIAKTLKLDPITTNFLQVLARNGRKGQLPQVTRLFRTLASEHRGEATAEIVSAHPLTDKQMAALKSKLKARAGRDVTIDATTDPAILGGLIVKLGSEMIDASLKTKLNRFALAMKG
ncbi:MAG TPA: F0F1 ATP synthase subunit delta [Sphingomicrobium sp.]|nr:F0F1 ATP synthase subunit delta [Sphingomicrobium sp.]